MGRPYHQELEELPQNIEFAHQLQIQELEELIRVIEKNSILLCGAGGSFSAAVFALELFHVAGIPASCITPLDFLQTTFFQQESTLILFSAGGRNRDVIQVIKHANNLHVRVVLFCCNEDSPASQVANTRKGNRIFDFNYPSRKDGFLAVNSLAATWWLLARAFGHSPPSATQVGKLIETDFYLDFKTEGRRHTAMVLFDKWTRAVAIDLESKLTESALCSPILSDWRQFGHGRHHWFAKNRTFSSIITLETNTCDKLADKTLSLLPEDINKVRLKSNLPVIPALCELLIKSFLLIQFFGKASGIDPGKPGVPEFGSKLYRLTAPLPKQKRLKRGSIDHNRAISRKLHAIGFSQPNNLITGIIKKSCTDYLNNLSSVKFGAVVVDFDGTTAPSGIKHEDPIPKSNANALISLLSKGMIIGVATGRGDSCHTNLTAIFPEKYWDQIYISHYNGADIYKLGDIQTSAPVWKVDKRLLKIKEMLNENPYINEVSESKFKNAQITLRCKSPSQIIAIENLIRPILCNDNYARLVSSSHTLDIIPKKNTKKKLVNFIQKQINLDCKILTIGDRGDIDGNDFDLLNNPYSLSVDKVSASFENCWNFLPDEVETYLGLAYYMNFSHCRKGHFFFKFT